MENQVKSIIESWGFSIDKIPESTDESPDFLVDDGDALHLVELKTKGDDSDKERAMNKALELGEIHSETIPFIRKNRISGIIRKVQSQLASSDETGVSCRLAWLAAIGRNQYAKKEQILATLYGLTGVLDIEKDPTRKPCYYFYNSDFFRYRNTLDGAILSWENSAIFCLNSYSPNVNNVKQSNLFKHFGLAAIDPLFEESNGNAYVVDSDLDRSDKNVVLEYLRDKYGSLSLMDMNIGQTRITIAADSEE